MKRRPPPEKRRGRVPVVVLIFEEEDAVLKRAEAKEADKIRVRIMEVSREKTGSLGDMVYDDTEEKDQNQLNDMGKEVKYNRSNVVSIAQMVKGTVDKGLSK